AQSTRLDERCGSSHEGVKDNIAPLAEGFDRAAGEPGREPGWVAVEIMGEPRNVTLVVDGIEEGLNVHGRPSAETIVRRLPCGYRCPPWASVMSPLVSCCTSPSTASR